MDLLLYGYALGIITVFMGGAGYSMLLDLKDRREHKKKLKEYELISKRAKLFAMVNGGKK